MPDPHPALVLIAALETARLRKKSRKKRLKRLRRVSKILTLYDEYADVVRIRPKADDAKLAAARKEAAEWWKRMVGILAGGIE